MQIGFADAVLYNFGLSLDEIEPLGILLAQFKVRAQKTASATAFAMRTY